MNAEIKTGLAGFYKFEVRRPDGSVRVETDWLPNLITNGGLDQIGKGNPFKYCSVGSGTAAPANTDSALAARIATTTSAPSTAGSGAQASAPYYGFMLYTFVFAQGAAAGNLSEVGVGWASDGSSLFSRALISPTITVLSDEVLTVVYQIRMYVPTTDVTGSVTIGGTSRAFVVRAANCTGASNIAGWMGPILQDAASPNGGVYVRSPASYTNACFAASAALGAITGAPTGGGTDYFLADATNAAYVDGNYYKDITISGGINDCNVSGGIKAVTFQCSLGFYQASFTPALEKDNTKTIALTFRISWARH